MTYQLKQLQAYVLMSKYAGMREDLVQAGGGNSAYKLSDEKMAIKASGYQLADVTEQEGYAIVNPKIIKEAFLNSEDFSTITDEKSKKILDEAFIEGARPSIETFLHSISGKYSLHTHPIVVNALTCRKNGTDILKKLFPDALIVSYATPGVELAKVYFKEYKKYKLIHQEDPKCVFLMNHGFLASADTADEVIALTEDVTQKIEEYLQIDMQAYHDIIKINSLYPDGITWLVTDHNVLGAYDNLHGIWQHYFCPDCVVFLGKRMYQTDEISKIEFEDFVEKYGYPVVVVYKENLYIHADSVKKALEIQSVLSFSAQVMKYNKGIECELLTEQEENFLLNWDAEKYRRSMK